MSSNTIAPICRSCQKGRSSNKRRVQRPSHVEEDYYTKYHNKQGYSDSRKERQNYPRNIYRRPNYNNSNNSNNSNNNDANQHVCMSCGNR